MLSSRFFSLQFYEPYWSIIVSITPAQPHVSISVVGLRRSLVKYGRLLNVQYMDVLLLVQPALSHRGSSGWNLLEH